MIDLPCIVITAAEFTEADKAGLIVHRHVRRVSIGKWDIPYTTPASIWEWPSLPGSPRHTRRDTTGAANVPLACSGLYDVIGRIVRPYDGWYWHGWDQRPVAEPYGNHGRYGLVDGRYYVPATIDSEDVILSAPELAMIPAR